MYDVSGLYPLSQNKIKLFDSSSCILQGEMEPMKIDESAAKGTEGGKKESEEVKQEKSHEATPGTLVYSREDVLGGHVACILGLLLSEKAFVEMDIPDNVVQCDTEAIDKLENSEEAFSSASITFMKRKLYANNLESVLEQEEDKVLEGGVFDDKVEEGKSVEAVADENLEGDSLGDGSKEERASKAEPMEVQEDVLQQDKVAGEDVVAGKLAQDDTEEVKIESSVPKEEKDPCSADSFRIVASVLEDVPNKKRLSDQRLPVGSSKGDKAIPGPSGTVAPANARIGQTAGNSQVARSGIMKPSFRWKDEKNEEKVVSFSDAGQSGSHVAESFSAKVVASVSESSVDRKRMNPESDGSTKSKEKYKLVNSNSEKEPKQSQGVVNFNMNVGSISTSFFSDPELIGQYKDFRCGATNPKQEFSYSTSLCDISGLKHSQKKLMPSKAFEVRKSKLYASRTTLMLHRAADRTHLQGKALTAHEALNINPMGITCYLHIRPYGENPFDNLTSCKRESECISEPSKTGNDESQAERFRKRDDFLHTEYEIENGLDSLSVDEFCGLMVGSFDWNESEIAFAREAEDCIKANRELGLTEAAVEEICAKYENTRDAEELVDMLLNFKIIYRVGMYTIRYVSSLHVRSWSINAPLSRGSDEEIIDVIAKKQLHAAIEDSKKATQDKDGGKVAKTGIHSKESLRKDNRVGDDDMEGLTADGKDIKRARSDFKETSMEDTAEDTASINNDTQKITDTKTAMKDSRVTDKNTEKLAILEDGMLADASWVEEKDKLTEENMCGDLSPLCGSLKAGQSLLHVKNGSDAKSFPGGKSQSPRKPVATIVRRIDDETAEDAQGTMSTGKAKQAARSRRIDTTLGHVLGPKSTKTELIYKRATCRPWLKLNCDFNLTLLRKFHRAILSLIMMYPGIKESRIYARFETVLKPVALRDILLFLELNGCISKHFSRKKKKTSLFDTVEKSSEAEFTFDDPYYMPKDDSILNIADNS